MAAEHRPWPELNQDNLKRSISWQQASAIAFNQTVGGGVVALTGVAIGLTGGGVPLAYVMAAITVMIVSLPFAAIGSALPVVGGSYTYAARLIHPIVGFGNMAFAVLAQTSLGLYGVTAGQYMHSLDPWFDPTWFGVAIISFFYCANLLGAVVGARLGLLMMFSMILALGGYIAFGLPKVDWNAYPPVLPHGFMPLFQAAALLTFATGGATVVVELGREMKHPGRDIPIAIFVGTLLAAALYVGIAVVTVGVLPVAQTANQPLSVAAAAFLPPPAFRFFILGGAMIALISTMNAQLLAGSKGLLAAIDDGWFPSRVGAVSKRFGTPHFLLTGLYLVGLVPVIFDIPVDVLASGISGIGQLLFILLIIASLRLRYVYPALHKAARFRLGLRLHWCLSIASIAVSCFQASILLSDGLSPEVGRAVLVIAAVILGYGVNRYPAVRRLQAARRTAL
jgi:APA family basic amino acid/polyamine antiporter